MSATISSQAARAECIVCLKLSEGTEALSSHCRSCSIVALKRLSCVPSREISRSAFLKADISRCKATAVRATRPARAVHVPNNVATEIGSMTTFSDPLGPQAHVSSAGYHLSAPVSMVDGAIDKSRAHLPYAVCRFDSFREVVPEEGARG